MSDNLLHIGNEAFFEPKGEEFKEFSGQVEIYGISHVGSIEQYKILLKNGTRLTVSANEIVLKKTTATRTRKASAKTA